MVALTLKLVFRLPSFQQAQVANDVLQWDCHLSDVYQFSGHDLVKGSGLARGRRPN